MKPFVYAPPPGGPAIVHRDDQIIVVDKPAGLLSVPGREPQHRDSVETRLRARMPDTLLVHRLDMVTSGLMIFARTANAQKSLGRQFQKRLVEKRYLAVVEGVVRAEEGEIDLPLGSDWPNRPRQRVDHEGGRPALTRWQVLDRRADSTVLALFPLTGRTHQLRVHLQAIGHPILGDEFYGDTARAPRCLLHAERLRLIRPGPGDRVTFFAPCPFFATEAPAPAGPGG